MEIDDKELLDFDSGMIILNKDKVKPIKIKASVSDDNKLFIENFCSNIYLNVI